MPELRPFAGILYDRSAVDLPQVVAPPYDVISPGLQAELYERDSHNVVRLILGRSSDPYAEAAQDFAEWLGAGVLRQDEQPAFYLLSQHFRDLDGRERTRTGVIGACRLEDAGAGAVLPHERTHHQPKEDRLKLFHATRAMFSQILGLYADRERVLDRLYARVLRGDALFEFSFDGVENSLHRIADPEVQLEIATFLHDRPALIADGHHRYETAVAYRDARRTRGTSGDEAWTFVPMYLTNMHGADLVVLPTHRLLRGLPSFDAGRFVESLRTAFDVRPAESTGALLQALPAERPHAFGLVLHGVPGPLLLKAKEDLEALHAAEPDGILWRLDVTVLHELMFKKILGIAEEAQRQKRFLEYEQDAHRAAAMARSGSAQAAFLLNATPVGDVQDVAAAGFVMPQKSTYFYPKLLSGLVTYSFNGRASG